MKYFNLVIGLLLSASAWACNFGMAHPVMWHYNAMDLVFIGTVVEVGDPLSGDMAYREAATNIPTFKIKFEVHKSYRGDMPAEIVIGKKALANLSFNEGDSYLVYALMSPDDGFYITSDILHILDPRMKNHSVLSEIDKNRNGHIVEYNKTGEKWAEGDLTNGIPVGEWKFYETTGELKEKGKYKIGKRHGKWETYFYTQSRFFSLFTAIRRGRALRYEMISHTKANPTTNRTYQLIYKDLEATGTPIDTVYYLYTVPILESTISYKNGKLHGKAKFFDSHGVKQGQKKYKNNQPHGKYWFRKMYNQLDGKKSTAMYVGKYVRGQIKNEVVTYFEDGKQTGTQQTVKDFQSN